MLIQIEGVQNNSNYRLISVSLDLLLVNRISMIRLIQRSAFTRDNLFNAGKNLRDYFTTWTKEFCRRVVWASVWQNTSTFQLLPTMSAQKRLLLENIEEYPPLYETHPFLSQQTAVCMEVKLVGAYCCNTRDDQGNVAK